MLASNGVTVILIPHQVGLVRQMTQRPALLEKGRMVKMVPTNEVLGAPELRELQGIRDRFSSVPRDEGG